MNQVLARLTREELPATFPKRALVGSKCFRRRALLEGVGKSIPVNKLIGLNVINTNEALLSLALLVRVGF
jgi:hypothetical protein